MYRLIVYTEHHSDHRPCWRDSGEGPWPNYFNERGAPLRRGRVRRPG